MTGAASALQLRKVIVLATTTTIAASTSVGLLAGIARGAVPARLFTDDAVLDAVVPYGRFGITGSKAVADVYGGWFFHPVRFVELRRHRSPAARSSSTPCVGSRAERRTLATRARLPPRLRG